MGRGNISVNNQYGGLYFVDYDNLQCYYEKENPSNVIMRGEVEDFNDYNYDEFLSEEMYEDLREYFIESFRKKFNSFTEPAMNSKSTIWLENSLFTIEVEDNEWSLAVKLLPKEQDIYSRGNIEALQKHHYQNYLNGMLTSLLEKYESIGIYTGPWTHGTVKREEFKSKTA